MTTIIPVAATNLPVAPLAYSLEYQNQLNNVIRFFMASASNAINATINAQINSPPTNIIGNSGTSFTMDCSLGDYHIVTMTGNVAAGNLTISGIQDGKTIRLVAIQDSVGGRTLGNPTGVKWPGGVPAPILSVGAGAIDMITFNRVSKTTYARVEKAFA